MKASVMKPIRVGLLGIGTVGSGTFNVLRRNQEEIRRRAGRAIEVVMVADLDTERAKQMTGGSVEIVSDGRQVVSHPDIDIVIDWWRWHCQRARHDGDRQR